MSIERESTFTGTMDARNHFLVALLSLVMFLAGAHAACDSNLPLGDPYPNENTVNVTYGGLITQIKLEENQAIRIAVFNCDDSDEPSILGFTTGSQMSLGLETETDGSKWYLVVKNAQDYENTAQRNYRFSVLAGSESHDVTLNIVNVDDNSPLFLLPDPTPCQIKETAIGQSSCLLVAKDADAILDGMKFRALEGENLSENISLVVVNNAKLCETADANICVTVGLYTKAELEFIERPVYSLLLEVEDQAGHIGNLSYVLQVIAENKEIPHFTPQKLEIYIDEEKTGLIETNDTTKITVSDRDGLDYGQFYLTVEGNDPAECYKAFDVIPSAGYRNANVKLSVIDSTKLDYDEGSCNDITVTIKATEISDDTRVGEAQVNVKLRDLNDESPVFEQEKYQFYVIERKPVGTSVGTVTANDRDAFDKITYSLTSTTYLKVDPDTGHITVNAELIYGRQQQVFATVRADDTAEPPHSNYTQIVVNVTDINDVRPVLTVPWSPVNIDEDVQVGTVLEVDITAFDEDTDPDLWFSIDWENSRAVKQGFSVEKDVFKDCLTIETVKDPANPNDAGAILKVNMEMDWETFDTLYVNINVDDKNTHPDYEENRNVNGILTVTINDINDCFPNISKIGELKFKENTEGGQLFGIILATDQDGPGFNEVKYYIENYLYGEEYVTIHYTSGELRTGNDTVDFEKIEELHYTVVATDGELRTLENITIQIEDVNDNTPYFVEGYNKIVSIEENNAMRMHLLTFEAHDNDKSSAFNTLRFFVEDQYRGTFEINTETGEMFVPEGEGTKLDYEDVKSYTIEVTVRDRCESGCYFDSLSNSTRITVELIDINDNPPVIENGGLLCTLGEDAEMGFQLGYVRATDKDSGINAELTFDIVGYEPEGQDLFHMTPITTQSALLTVKGDLLNKWKNYTLKVKASDPDFSDTADFIISVIDVNNNYPEFEFPNDSTVLRFNIFNNVPGNVLTDVNGNEMNFNAIDKEDCDLNGTAGMSYSVIGDDTAKKYLEMKKSQLILIKAFEEDMEKNFKLQLEACDGEFEEFKLCTKTETDVRMRFNEELEPTFNENVWGTNFTENVTGLSEFRKITVPVTDLNNFDDCEETENDCDEDPIYYFIYEGDKNIFQLDKGTAVLSLKQQLDREEKDTYTLIVFVTNFVDGPLVSPAEESKLTITIYVDDVHDTAPVFNRSLFAAGINVGDKTNDLVTNFFATSFDLNDALTYTIIESSMDVTDDSLETVAGNNPFRINDDKLLLNFNFRDATLRGMFVFKVQVTNKGFFTDEATCQVYIISEDNLVVMTFTNNVTFVESKRNQITEVYSSVFKSQSNVKNIDSALNSNGESMDDRTDVTSYFVDDTQQQPISKDEIQKQLNNKEIYNELRRALFVHDIDLYAIADSTDDTSADTEGVLQTVLIVVAVVLGTLVVVLFAAFFIRTRSLNRRLEALSTTKFGSQDSGLNRIGTAVPNTNQHAVEGSNPIWNNEEVVQRNFDNVSVSSGDSDLIGVEENPEFSTFGNSGIANDGFIPESAEGRRVSVNPMFAAGLSQLSASALQKNATVNKSVNPLAAEMQYKDSYDSENDSGRSSEIVAGQNNNFTFYGRMDSIPTTEL